MVPSGESGSDQLRADALGTEGRRASGRKGDVLSSNRTDRRKTDGRKTDRLRTDRLRAEGRRADAQRNIAAILDAASACLTSNPDASIADIAQFAGVGRVTLYGHFSSRGELVDRVFTRTIELADRMLDTVDLTGDARQALGRLIDSTWQIVHQQRALLAAAERALPAERIRELHDRPLDRLRSLIDRGRAEGAFRTDLPVSWMIAVYFSVLHGAADEISAGRLADDVAGEFIAATLLQAFAAPGRPGVSPSWAALA